MVQRCALKSVSHCLSHLLEAGIEYGSLNLPLLVRLARCRVQQKAMMTVWDLTATIYVRVICIYFSGFWPSEAGLPRNMPLIQCSKGMSLRKAPSSTLARWGLGIILFRLCLASHCQYTVQIELSLLAVCVPQSYGSEGR
jgi:hypothetical protein